MTVKEVIAELQKMNLDDELNFIVIVNGVDTTEVDFIIDDFDYENNTITVVE